MVEKKTEAFRNITEVSEMLGIPTHVLRFWETRFSQLKPRKGNGGRRYYRPEDIVLLKKIQALLYSENYTIKGAQQVLKSFNKPKEDEAVESLSAEQSGGQDGGQSYSQSGDAVAAASALLTEARNRLARISQQIA